MALAERPRGFAETGNVVLVFSVHLGAGFMEVNRAVLTFLVRAGGGACEVLRDGRLYWPGKRMDWAERQDGRPLIPARLAQRSAPILGRVRVKGPRRIRSELGMNAELAQQCLRLRISRDDQRIPDVTPAHPLDEAVHVAGLGAIADRELVLRRRQAQRADHHGRQRVGEFALEHRAFARNHAVVLPHFAEKERRINVGQMHLLRPLEVTACAVEVLRHHAERDILSAEHMANLTDHLLHAHIGAGIARPVVARKEQLQLFARSPTAAETEHPADAPNLDQSADAGHEEKIGHARAPFTATAAAGAFSGQGTYGYSK